MLNQKADSSRSGALDGITVLDITGSVATGYCGKLFADHGARVIDVEPPAGFPTRSLAPRVGGESRESAFHAWLSTNKLSIIHQEDEALLPALAAKADVLLAGDTACVPIDDLATNHPHLVVNEITWFGKTGPYAGYRGSDAAVQSLAGLVKGIGKPEAPPLLPSGYQAQVVAGLTAFVATMTCVLAREIGNRDGGTRLDTSILEANLCFTEVGAVGAHKSGYAGGRRGINRFPPTYPIGIYPCRDGWLGVTALTPSQWLSFCELIGLAEQASEKRYLAVRERLRDAEILDPLIAAAVRDRSARELFERGQAMRVPLAPVPTMEELFHVDQYVERGAFADIALPSGSQVSGPVTPFRLFASPAIAGGTVAVLGADNERLKEELL